MAFVERLRNSQPTLWRRLIAAGSLSLCVAVAGLLIPTYGYAQLRLRMEPKIERRVQPREPRKEEQKPNALEDKSDLFDASPELEEHNENHLEGHIHQHHCREFLQDPECHCREDPLDPECASRKY
jgi:hypothetical protein